MKNSLFGYLPTKSKAKITASWYIACPRIFFIIVLEISGFVRPYGFLNRRSGVGISVARANEANVSIIKLTHNICTACKIFCDQILLKVNYCKMVLKHTHWRKVQINCFLNINFYFAKNTVLKIFTSKKVFYFY